ncbi:hypothetical protein G7Y79_00052g087810 [Physcia stellaris]|nr:hypothetical protein G7Y79_00052g087810 [Physcia stellaris]
MVMYEPPYCAICGGPFDHVELLDFSDLSEDEQYTEECFYDSRFLSPAQSAWVGKFQILAESNKDGPFLERNDLADPDFFVSAEGEWQQNDDWFDLAPGWASENAEGRSSEVYTRFKDYFVIHSACMKILEIFIRYQSKFASVHSPKTMQEFIDACFDRQEESIELCSKGWTPGVAGGLPSNWAAFQNVEHSHLYFGARRFWADPWDCKPGFEYLCADPMREPFAEAFISRYLARPPSSIHAFSSSTLDDTSSSGKELMELPRELLDHIVTCLPLYDALNFCSTSRELLKLTGNNFWRSQTLQMHSCWFWELLDLPKSSSKNWKALLQKLTASRREILEEAEPYWLDKPTSRDNGSINFSKRLAEAALLPWPLPFGIRNRQRIWMCLETVGMTAEWEVEKVQQNSSKGRGLGRKA